METGRLDKWLWSVRLYKSRTQATDACKSGHITADSDDRVLKSSHQLKIGEAIIVRKAGINFKIVVSKLIPNRVSATLAKDCFEDQTSEEELKKFDINFLNSRGVEWRERGTGRPTKKERREIDDFKSFGIELYEEL